MFKFLCNGRILPHFRVYFSSSWPIYKLISRSQSSSSSISSNQESFKVNYLINSCGFTPESALSISKYLKKKMKTPDNPVSVLALFKNHGFTKTQIVYITKKYPKVLLRNPDKTLLPKLEYLRSIGFLGPDIAKMVVGEPLILFCGIENILSPAYNFFRDLLQSDEKTIGMFRRFPYMLVYGTRVHVVQNVQTLRDAGVPESNIIFYVAYHSRGLMRQTDKFRKKVEKVKEMGFDPLKHNFMCAFNVFASLSKSTLEKKVGVYKKWGWSEDDVLVSFQKNPVCLSISEDKIKSVMDIFVNKIGLDYSHLVTRPQVFLFSLEKRIIPRYLFYQVLLDKCLIKKESKSSSVIGWVVVPESIFIRRIKNNFKEEASELLKLYQTKLNSAKLEMNMS